MPKSEAFTIAVSVPRAAPEGVLALTNARVVTMNGDQILASADLVITGNRITAMGASGTVTIPSTAHKVDVAGATIVPGLIDTHAHLHYSGFEVLPETKWEYAANLAFGVTTTYDPSAPSLDVFEQGEMVEAGRMLGPRVYSSGDVLYGGQQEDIYAQVDDQEDARRQVRRMKAYGARMIKVYQQPRRDERLWLAQACREEHMLLTAEGAGELQTDLSMVIDGFTAFEHALPYELHDDVVQLLAHAGTLLHADAHRRVWRARGRGLLLPDEEPARRREAAPLRAAPDARPAGTPASVGLARRVPLSDGRRGRGARREGGRSRLARRARATAGARRALGAVGDGR